MQEGEILLWERSMRSSAREAAFKIVFAEQFNGNDEAFRRSVYRHDRLTEEDISFAEALVGCVSEHRDELNGRIAEKTTQYPDHRIYPADRAVMLIALAEISYFDDIPPVVSVNEATNLARKYSSETSTDFVNGVLGGIINA